MDQSSSDEEAEPNVVVVPTHGGQYVKFTKEGFDFEVSSRYTPPIQLLGCGACGPVCSMIDSITGEKVAVKKFVNGVNDPDYAKRTIREIKLLRLMNHENNCSVSIRIRTIDNPNRFLCSAKAQARMTRYILSRILRGLKYIHSEKVFHRGSKPANILVNFD
uniref:Protein kinase domain-containing protein n=1 Tax=Physcomitrium patens TaxID=3218 RepID=A0A7I4BIX7_PHYPA